MVLPFCAMVERLRRQSMKTATDTITQVRFGAYTTVDDFCSLMLMTYRDYREKRVLSSVNSFVAASRVKMCEKTSCACRRGTQHQVISDRSPGRTRHTPDDFMEQQLHA
jgi:hypothetical protein